MELDDRAVDNEARDLDNVVWQALTGRQRHLALGTGSVRRYAAAIAPFAAMADSGPGSVRAVRQLVEAEGPAALVTPVPFECPVGLSVARAFTVLQMTWGGGAKSTPTAAPIRLGEGDVPEMLALAAATQPGPFGARTIELGDYLGVRRDGRLAAMAGERMKIDGHTEISAVCVDPAVRGQGLAAGLIRSLIASIGARGETPFLHVLTSNEEAIAIYRRMGFVDRRVLHLALLQSAAS